MFDRVCSACHKRQLVFPSQVTSVANTDHGIAVAYVCWCGEEQVWLTGKGAVERRTVDVAA